MKKKKHESPYRMRTVQCAQILSIKIWLKCYETKPVFMMQPQDHVVFFWFVTSKDGYRRKFANEETARTKFAQLIEFEKHQTVIAL